ncbi:MAG TPA: DNA-3-methyladenine glycosylase [Tepidisphaeraceae bacterium]|jgi:DNA-3-methyladenine glycosylase
MNKLPRSFYGRDAAVVAPDLLGKILVHRFRNRELRARIVETEAYVGEHDLACHAAKGRTKRTEVMYGPAGHAYVYFIYGMYDMLNIVCAPIGNAQAVLIRAAEPLDDWEADLSGPGKLCREMSINVAMNGTDLIGERLFLLEGPPPDNVVKDKRIGIDYAKEWKDELLRFYDGDSSGVSKRPGARTKRGQK